VKKPVKLAVIGAIATHQIVNLVPVMSVLVVEL